MYKTIGILGGMGPASTCDFMSKIISHTAAADDQHHIHICIDCNTDIPDRTNAILHHGSSPVPELIKSGVRLQTMGADFLVIPCNTAHYFYDQITPYLDIPVMNMLTETARYLERSNVKKAGILATDGTILSNVYETELKKRGISAVYPGPEHQKVIMSLIYDYIKKGITDKKQLPSAEIRDILDELQYRGAQKIVLACTELPIAFQILGIQDNIIDPTMILALEAIKLAGADVKYSGFPC